MKRSLTHLPPHKRQELHTIKDIILEVIPQTAMIILFGSYARGDWVEDVYTEGHITYEYHSDFDILIILLKRAYVDARYKKNYKITKKQLEYLATRIKKLQRLTKKICTEKIESFAN